jgi:putative ABC transport system ATP-binding protein
MIKIRDLHFGYPSGGFRLDVAELDVAAGTSVAIIGASGSGKTTLLNLVAGVVLPEAGQVITNSVPVSELDDARRRDFRIRHIGMIFQEFELLEYLSVLDNILLPYRISPSLQLNAEVQDRARQLAEKVDIADKLKRPIRRLSQGERQRVAICRSLLTEPPLLLADEPTGNLDPENTATVLDILFNHVRESGTTLVCVTHERDHLDRFDHIVDFARFRKGVSHA